MSSDAAHVKDAVASYRRGADTQEVPPGYKWTEVGAIPIEWSLPTVGDVFDCMKTASNSRSQLDGTGEVGYIHYGDIHTRWNHFVDFNVVDVPRLSSTVKATATQLKDGDLIVADASEDEAGVGKSVEVRGLGDRKAISGLHTIFLRAKDARTRVGYRGYLLESQFVKAQLRKVATGLKVFGVSKKAMREVLLPLPPPKEQRAIAEALSGVDGLLGALEALIAKKRAIKQAAMQQLLTGKTRLPGFSGEWEKRRIKDIVKVPVTDGPHLTPKFLADGIPFLSVNNLADNRVDVSDIRYISAADHREFSKKCKPQKWDVLLAKAASVGKVAIVDFDWEFNVWSPIAVIRLSDSVDPRFGYYGLQGVDIIKQIEYFTNSSSQGNIGMGDIEKIELPLPSPEEQKSIAMVLSDMDAEIAALERRRDKTRAIKQGMMQQLLTGRVRLVEPPARGAQC